MRTRMLQFACLLLAVLLICPVLTSGQEAREAGQILLPKPQMDGGVPLMQALKARRSTREYSEKKIPEQVLSNLLWAAFGVNRPKEGKRTAPSAMNWQEIDIYVAAPDGLYLYDAKSHTLDLIVAEDLRALTGSQEYVKTAALNLVYVADFTRMGKGSVDNKIFCSAADTGFISQNVYLFCASEGLGTVVRGYIDKPALAKAMYLGPDQRIILAQCVGYPKMSKTSEVETVLQGLYDAIERGDAEAVRKYYSDPEDGVISTSTLDHEIASMSQKHHVHLRDTTFVKTVVGFDEQHPSEAFGLIVYSDGKEMYSISVALVRTGDTWFVVDVDSKGRKVHLENALDQRM